MMQERAEVINPPSFEFAVVVEPNHSAKDWSAVVRSCEDLGYDTLLVTDHLHLRLAAVPALAMAAGLTTRIRLGSYVLNSDLRDPVLLAKEMATVHTLSEGRAVVGLGAGWLRTDYEQAGIAMKAGAARVERLRAALRPVREVLAEAAATNGSPVPPLLLGGARRRILELAGREADIVGVLPPLGPAGPADYTCMLADHADTQLDWVRAGAAGRITPPRLNHLLWGCFVTRDPAAVNDALARSLGCPPQLVPQLVPYLVGTVDQVARELLARHARWGFTLVTVPSRAATSFAPVMRALRRQ
ncbi:TIGR03621 family F420-dependent LLM class oxidoreductase [Streptomyces sp. NPDC001027]|uniref:TIGR03621 family F420-dependent LLM class oxidoreductase n=1 Tax=Streptomyces sp. NPDC001027 TaxID=3154771 RepID=UPI00332E84DC